MRLRLRQIALAVEDLVAARAQTTEIFGVSQYHEDPGVARYGLDNAVYPFGETFLEHVSPKRDGTTVGRLLAKRRGDGGYMVILQTDSIDEARARIAAAGVRVADRIDRDGVGFTHLHPRDVGGTLLSIDYMREWDDWQWAGPDWRQAGDGDAPSIVAAEMQGSDPQAMAERWSWLLDRPARPAGDGWNIALDEGELRFVPLRDDRGEGFRAFDVRSADPQAILDRADASGATCGDGRFRFCGMVVNVRPS